MANNATVLVVDGGGRGAALVDKYHQSPQVSRILAVPGNDLMLASGSAKIFPQIKNTDYKSIIKIAKKYKVDLIDVAQDDAVASGVTDQLQRENFTVFGPTKPAGKIEWDKAWAREFMKQNKIPTPNFKICRSQKEGIKFINSQKEGEWFIKASGLAAGKGALYAKNNKDAIKNINLMKNFGQSGETYLIEECLKGEEFSSFAIVDGRDFLIIGHAQDHKTVYDGNLGPNTGGMGCSSPPMAITKKIEKQIKSIFKKAAQGLTKIGRPYLGILYLGGMIVKEGRPARRSPGRSRTSISLSTTLSVNRMGRMGEGRIYVIEFNARWGDPEAQVILPSIKNDLYQIAKMATAGEINKIKIKKDNLYRVVVTAASRGYPTDYSKVVGKQIIGLAPFLRHPELTLSSRTRFGIYSGSIKIYGAGVKKIKDKYFVHGGRLFYVMAQGKNVAAARNIAYNALSKIKVEGDNLHYRTDIGWRDVERMRKRTI